MKSTIGYTPERNRQLRLEAWYLRDIKRMSTKAMEKEAKKRFSAKDYSLANWDLSEPLKKDSLGRKASELLEEIIGGSREYEKIARDKAGITSSQPIPGLERRRQQLLILGKDNKETRLAPELESVVVEQAGKVRPDYVALLKEIKQVAALGIGRGFDPERAFKAIRTLVI